MKYLKELLTKEKGQALPIVLAMLALGSLVVVPGLNYARGTVGHTNVVKQGIFGNYAADSGVEYVLWCLKHGTTPPTTLPQNVNGMSVELSTDNRGACTFYLGDLVDLSEHNNYLDVSGNVTWNEGASAYQYTITVVWQPDSGKPTIHLNAIGARLPVGYSYLTGSASSFPSNLSPADPTPIQDSNGVNMVNWVLTDSPYLDQSEPVKTQSFYMTGPSEQTGNYVWVVASRSDIGEVGEVSGDLYRITATATRSGTSEVTGIVTCDALIAGSTINIILWQVHK